MLKDAGVDEGIMTDSQVDIGPETDGVLADAESDTRDKQEEGDSNALDGNEVDTREKPPTVSDTKTKMIARRRRMALARIRRQAGLGDFAQEWGKGVMNDLQNLGGAFGIGSGGMNGPTIDMFEVIAAPSNTDALMELYNSSGGDAAVFSDGLYNMFGGVDDPNIDWDVLGNEIFNQYSPQMGAAGRRRRALGRGKQRQGKDIFDDAENVTKDMQPAKPSGNTTDDPTFDSQDTPGSPRGDVLADEDNDIRTANLNKLYRHRLEKKLAAEKEHFVRKFTRALRLASTRMLLNHEEHPLKSAAVDVLTGEDIQFMDGQHFTGMDMATALELTELIAAEGHDRFMANMLARAADLLEKDDQYLADAEDDLKDQAPAPVGDAGQATARKSGSRNRRSSRVRREAAEGNFAVTNNGPPASGPGKVSGGIRDAVGGGTLLGRRLGRLRG